MKNAILPDENEGAKGMCVTIIIPVHNSEKYLKQCIESAMNQTFREIEILCIDGGSTDGSHKIIEELREKDGRIQYLYDTNTGYGHKINVGIDNAKGEYFAILESDDRMSPRMIEELYSIAIKKRADVIDADYYELFSYKGKTYLDAVKKYAGSDSYNCLIEGENRISKSVVFKSIWTALYRKEFIVGNNIRLNESKGASYQDSSFIFWVNILAKSFYHLDVPLYQYRVDNEGSSVKDDKKIFEIIGEYEFLKKDMEKRGIQESDKWLLYYKRKYESFYWNYERLSPSAREVFLDRYIQELRQDIKSGGIKREFFMGDSYDWTFRLIEDKVSFSAKAEEHDRQPSKLKFLEKLENIKNRKIVIFGAGAWGSKAIDILMQGSSNLCAVCDNSDLLQGTVKNGFPIISVEEAVKVYPDAVYLIANRNYGEEMKMQLLKEKIQEENVMLFEWQ